MWFKVSFLKWRLNNFRANHFPNYVQQIFGDEEAVDVVGAFGVVIGAGAGGFEAGHAAGNESADDARKHVPAASLVAPLPSSGLAVTSTWPRSYLFPSALRVGSVSRQTVGSFCMLVSKE